MMNLVRYIDHNNRGSLWVRARRIKEVSYDLSGFIGQDDLWMPDISEVTVYSVLTNLNRFRAEF